MKTTMLRGFAVCVLFLGALVNYSSRADSNPENKVHYEPTWESLAQKNATPQWYQDAVLGFYFHWGAYSVPAIGCWGPHNMYKAGSWPYERVKKLYGEPGREWGYKDFIPLWKADKWDPDYWASLFKHAGADFAGPCAEHHDGFALWDTAYDEWNSVDMGPRIDIVKKTLDAVREHGMKTVITVHYWRTYVFFNYGRKLCPDGVDVNDPAYAGLYGPAHEVEEMFPTNYPGEDWPKSYWEERVNKTKELIDKYRPDSIWLEIMDQGKPPEPMKREMLAHYFNAAEGWGEEVVITHKHSDLPDSCSPLDVEVGVLDEPRQQKWQTDIPLGDSWAYTPNVGCKEPDELVDLVVNNVSKNGLTLFSVAPKADGTLPEEQVEGLKKLGEWMAINKPALYATTPASFDKAGTYNWKSGSLRYLRKDKYLYAIDLEKPTAPRVIPDVTAVSGSEIKMLGSDKSLTWRQDGDDLVIEEFPDPLPCDYAWSFKIQVLDESW